MDEFEKDLVSTLIKQDLPTLKEMYVDLRNETDKEIELNNLNFANIVLQHQNLSDRMMAIADEILRRERKLFTV